MENYKYFHNTECEYYPCHKMPEGQELNCLFCYCPLYALGDKCGGDFVYTEKGTKKCTGCTKPHGEDGHAYVLSKIRDVLDMVKKEN